MEFNSVYPIVNVVTEVAYYIWLRFLFLLHPSYITVQFAYRAIVYLRLILYLILLLSVKTIELLLTTYYYVFSFIILYVIRLVTRIEHLLESTMEPKAAELLAVLKNNNLSIDIKVSHLLGIKSEIKQKNVPDTAVPTIFESLRLSIASHHSALYAAGFSTLGHFLKRLFIQEQHHIVSSYARYICPVLLERLGDHKERVRAQAAQAFTDLWPAAGLEIEHYVLEVALTGKNPKAKEMSLIWLSNMSKNHGLLFRSYVPSLIACLEDADSVVRDTAKSTTVELFQNAPARAKSDLTREMAAQNVRKSIVNAILSNIGLGSAEPDQSSSARPLSRTETRPASRVETHHHPPRPLSRADGLHQRPVSVMAARPQIHTEPPREATPLILEPESIKTRPGSSKSEQEHVTVAVSEAGQPSHMEPPRPSSQEGEPVVPVLVGSTRHVEDLTRAMLPHFEGRESEDNWLHREKSIAALRRLTYGNAPQDYPQPFYAAIKSLLDGIFKAVNSLRTTLSSIGCLLIQDLAKVCGPKLDPMVEIIMQNLIKLCGGMKKISAQNGTVTLNAVLANVTYTARILHHVTGACQDKNVQLRLHAAAWLKTLINKQAHNKSSIEHGGGLEILEKSMKKGLSDANPSVREAMRSAFWTFYRVWPSKGNNILSDLDNKARLLLEKDPSNPNIDQSTSQHSSSRKGLTSSTPSSRSALKEAIAAQKKARLAPAKTLPPRPESAQSAFSETKSSDLPSKTSTVRTVPTGAPVSSLSSAPMRPGAKPRRPEMARPATADPYSSRRSAHADVRPKTPAQLDSSPRQPKLKPSTPSKQISATRPRQKTDLGQAASSTKSKPKKLDISMAKLSDPFTTNDPPRTGSNGTSSGQSSAHVPTSTGFLDRPESPACVQLESPTDFVEQLVAPPVTQGALSVPNDTVTLHDQLMLSNQQTQDQSHDGSAEANSSVQPVGVASSYTDKRPESVVIYEDPVTTRSEPDDGESIQANVHIESDTQKPEIQITTTHAVAADERKDELEVSADHSNPDSKSEAGSRVSGLELPSSFGSGVGLNNSPFPSDLLQSTPEYSLKPIKAPRIPLSNENWSPKTPIAAEKHASPTASNRALPKNNALGELPSNEPDHRANIAIDPSPLTPRLDARMSESTKAAWSAFKNEGRQIRHNKRRNISPRSQDPERAREMLRVAPHRIRSHTLDMFGHRKLQTLIHHHDVTKVMDQATFDDLVQAVLEELRSRPDERPLPYGDSVDFKMQVLNTLHLLETCTNRFFKSCYPEALQAILYAVRYFETTSWFVAELRNVAVEFLMTCERADDGHNQQLVHYLDAILDFVEQETRDTEGHKAINMAFSLLAEVLVSLNGAGARLPERLMERLGSLAATDLMSTNADVRRQVTELCVQLRFMAVSDDHFWEVVGQPRGTTRHVLAYYISRQQ
ncbi:hypothetical protein BBP40_000127 [Aspergillus hancockii]|nr:hypothetical protein BBP40_000127 [Aspergillus hancockii]